jgi:putative NADPH-quinone reductase
MECLVVTAHPLPDSLSMALTNRAVARLRTDGHDVVLENLYQEAFDPVLSVPERESYYSPSYDSSQIADQVDRLLAAEALVLVFPTWWFGFPAVLKGWFDRVWGPGIAYDHTRDFGPIKPRLKQLKRVLVITTLGAPWWVDKLIMRQPVKKIVKIALLSTCAPQCKFEMLSLYKCENLRPEKLADFELRIDKALGLWRS